MIVGIILHHLVEIQPVAPLARHGHAYQPLCVGGHEVNVSRGGETGRADAVALVFAILIVGHHNNLASRQRSETILDIVKSLFQSGRYFTISGQFWHVILLNTLIPDFPG